MNFDNIPGLCFTCNTRLMSMEDFKNHECSREAQAMPDMKQAMPDMNQTKANSALELLQHGQIMHLRESLKETKIALSRATEIIAKLKYIVPCLCASGDGSTCDYCVRIKKAMIGGCQAESNEKAK